VSDSFVLAFVPGVTPAKWVGIWKERMPRVPIEVRPLSSDDALAAVLADEATVALLREPFTRDGLNAIGLYEELAVVVAPKDHPIVAFDELSRDELVGENVLGGSAADAVELVAANVGVAIMPQSVARLHSRKDVVARILQDEPTTRIALVWRDSDPSELIEEFIGIVRGRTANSSRGAVASPAAKPAPKKPEPKKPQTRQVKPRRR
jgi:DNA-binding transcriptional LysR family regulator